MNNLKLEAFSVAEKAKLFASFGASSGENRNISAKCEECQKTVFAAEHMIFDDKTYHRGCFKCCKCQRPLGISNAISFHGNVYCVLHNPSLDKQAKLTRRSSIHRAHGIKSGSFVSASSQEGGKSSKESLGGSNSLLYLNQSTGSLEQCHKNVSGDVTSFGAIGDWPLNNFANGSQGKKEPASPTGSSNLTESDVQRRTSLPSKLNTDSSRQRSLSYIPSSVGSHGLGGLDRIVSAGSLPSQSTPDNASDTNEQLNTDNLLTATTIVSTALLTASENTAPTKITRTRTVEQSRTTNLPVEILKDLKDMDALHLLLQQYNGYPDGTPNKSNSPSSRKNPNACRNKFDLPSGSSNKSNKIKPFKQKSGVEATSGSDVDIQNFLFIDPSNPLLQTPSLVSTAVGYRIEETLSDYATLKPIDDLQELPAPSDFCGDMSKVVKELTETFKQLVRSPYHNFVMDHIDILSLYYREHFMNRDHCNYIGALEYGPVIISVMREFLEPDDNKYRIIIRRKDVPDIRLEIVESRLRSQCKIKGKLSRKTILQYVNQQISIQKLIKIQTSKVEKELIKLDELKLVHQYKIGLLYCKAGQKTEEEFFGNETGSPSFHRFIEILGEMMELQGFQGFTAGLDTKNGNTGKQTLHAHYGLFEITFHVSTFLPFVKDDPQQIQRKRHIGNDIVCIVFMDGPGSFDPTAIKSQFLHSYIIVSEIASTENGEPIYKVCTATVVDVPIHGPPLPDPPLFMDKTALRNFILAKAINAENACYKAPKFAKLSARTRHALIDDIFGTYTKSNGLDPNCDADDDLEDEEPSSLAKGRTKSDFNIFFRNRRRSSTRGEEELNSRLSMSGSHLMAKAQNLISSISRKKSSCGEQIDDDPEDISARSPILPNSNSTPIL